jgi:hypothetical protein
VITSDAQGGGVFRRSVERSKENFYPDGLDLYFFVLLLQYKKIQIEMKTATLRKPASFRLKSDLIDTLKLKAKESNRSLNNYVESILLNAIYNEPNEVTLAAIQEAKGGNRNLNEVFGNVKDLMKYLTEE